MNVSLERWTVYFFMFQANGQAPVRAVQCLPDLTSNSTQDGEYNAFWLGSVINKRVTRHQLRWGIDGWIVDMSAIECRLQKRVLCIYLQKPWKKYGTFQTGCSYFIIAIANHFEILQLEKGDTHFLMMGRNTKVIRYGQPYK